MPNGRSLLVSSSAQVQCRRKSDEMRLGEQISTAIAEMRRATTAEFGTVAML